LLWIIYIESAALFILVCPLPFLRFGQFIIFGAGLWLSHINPILEQSDDDNIAFFLKNWPSETYDMQIIKGKHPFFTVKTEPISYSSVRENFNDLQICLTDFGDGQCLANLRKFLFISLT
jgi:hypothetical protein